MVRLSLLPRGGGSGWAGGAPRGAPRPDPLLLFHCVVLAEIRGLLYCFFLPPLVSNCQFSTRCWGGLGGGGLSWDSEAASKASASLCNSSPKLSTPPPHC